LKPVDRLGCAIPRVSHTACWVPEANQFGISHFLNPLPEFLCIELCEANHRVMIVAHAERCLQIFALLNVLDEKIEGLSHDCFRIRREPLHIERTLEELPVWKED
jgi:hypothetical protein